MKNYKPPNELTLNNITMEKEYGFDCWLKGDGTPLKRKISANSESEAILKFEELYPDMEYDSPYEL